MSVFAIAFNAQFETRTLNLQNELNDLHQERNDLLHNQTLLQDNMTILKSEQNELFEDIKELKQKDVELTEEMKDIHNQLSYRIYIADKLRIARENIDDWEKHPTKHGHPGELIKTRKVLQMALICYYEGNLRCTDDLLIETNEAIVGNTPITRGIDFSESQPEFEESIK